MEKIKKFGYYLFIYTLFAIWLFLLGVFLFMSFSLILIWIINFLDGLSIKILPEELLLILSGIITIILFCIPIRYFKRIKHKETAKIKDIILAVIFVVIDYYSFLLTFIIFFGLMSSGR